MMLKVYLYCLCAVLISAPLAAEEEIVVDATELEMPVEFPDEMEIDLDDDELYLDELAAMEDEMYDEFYFEDEDELDAMTATDGCEQDCIPVELPTSVS